MMILIGSTGTHHYARTTTKNMFIKSVRGWKCLTVVWWVVAMRKAARKKSER